MSVATWLFLATVVGVGVAAGRALTEVTSARPVGLGAWLAVCAVLAQTGWLAQFDARPPHFFVFMTATLGLTLVLAFSPLGARLADGLSFAALTGFQVFRVAVELVLFELHRDGVVPVQMTFEGLNFDVLSGASAPLVAWLAARGRIGRLGLGLWNAAALALLANIVTIAVLSTPTPLRAFTNEPANTFVTQLPWVWLPGFLVPMALIGHLLSFRKLARMR